MSELQTVDPEVSRAKFAREVADYRALEDVYRKRGQILLDATFPEVCVMFAAPKLRPSPVLACVIVNFTDYDVQPLSVRFIDPFTREPVKAKDLPLPMLRRPPVPPGMPMEMYLQLLQQGQMPVNLLLQNNGPEEPPFLCLPRVREYHDNPAHTGDSWFLHRHSGEGSLAFILDTIWSHGINPVEHYQFVVQAQMPMIGVGVNFGRVPD
ncbi:hypothetical protein QO001_003912 [Methylobacterium brachiatum]|uniref:Metal binding domain-containing protein n=1 Tax=Methylobacterium brachiatum TaxID=269660 RepID=A0AAJ1TUF3_9HYPH|nr:putative metal-binding protein [Methylobacterium brachiatum]MCB4803720.1 hypothetical protein [Methylobacterium brachiatum]MDQ0544974.1 hypothetical protein [Methylobacterium brachiatum]